MKHKSVGLVVALLLGVVANESLASCVEGQHMRFNSINLTLPPSAIPTLVAPNSSTIQIDVDCGLKSGGDWDSTSIEIVGVGTQCFNNTGNNDSVNGGVWVNRTKTFTLTAPDITGIYEVVVTIFRDENCDGCDISHDMILGVGVMGPQGPQGEPGQDGADGQDGQDGEDGTDGQDGQDGTDGEDGADGQDGQDGADGQDGEDGEDGADGIGCSVVDNEDGTSTLTCGSESETITLSDGADGLDGINCYDLNGNGTEDLCDPLGLAEFGSCEDFAAWCLQPEVIEDVSASKLGSELKVYSAYSYNEGGFKCGFTEDTNGDATVDVLDCRGQDGNDGEDGNNGNSGADGSSCSVLDNKNGTYTMTCEDGTTVTWADGTDGLDGQDGADGSDGNGIVGRPGESCSLVENIDGTATLTCGNVEFVVGEVNSATGEIPDGRLCGSADALSLLFSAGALAVAAGFMPNRNRRKF